jgi:hypothetical membrane protein
MNQAATMSKPNDYYVLLAGLLGLLLGILLAKPKKVAEAVFAVLAGLFAALVIAPMIAEIFTNLSAYSYLIWLRATPDTSLYSGIVGLCSLLGYQIVLAVKEDFLNWIRKFANKRLKLEE